MSKQKLIMKAVELYKQEMKILIDEEKLLDKRKELCFERFLDRCYHVQEMSWWARLHEEASVELDDKEKVLEKAQVPV